MSDNMSEEKKEKGIKEPENMVIYNPDKPLYSRQHLCIYLRELYDLAEMEEKEAKQIENKVEDK